MNVQKELYRPWLVLVVPPLSRSSESSKHILLSVWLHLRKPEKIQRHFTHLFVLHIKNAQFVSSERRYVRVWGTATRFVHGILEMLPIKQTQTNLNGFIRPTWLTQPLSTIQPPLSKKASLNRLQISLSIGWPIFKRNIKKDVIPLHHTHLDSHVRFLEDLRSWSLNKTLERNQIQADFTGL